MKGSGKVKKEHAKSQRTKLEHLDIQWIGKKEGKRILGCQSTNHTICEGELWECERCHKIVCWEEGSTDLPDVCDDCWLEIRSSDPEYAYLFNRDFKIWLVKKNERGGLFRLGNKMDADGEEDMDGEL